MADDVTIDQAPRRLLDGSERIPVATSEWAYSTPDDLANHGGGYDVVILGGQSNMVGFTSTDDVVDGVDPDLDWTDPRIYQWPPFGGNGANPDYPQRLHRVLQEPLMWRHLSGNPNWHEYWGPSAGMKFALGILKLRPNRDIVLIPAALGGAGLVDSDWNPAAPDWLFEFTVTAATNAIRALPNARLSHILWVQGEKDAFANVDTTLYRETLVDLLTAFRTQIPNAQDAEVIVGQMVPEFIGTDPSSKTVSIDRVHRTISKYLPRATFVQGPRESFTPGNNIHYNADGQRTLGERMWKKVWTPCFRSQGKILDTPTNVSVLGLTVSWTVPASDASLYALEYRSAGSSAAYSRIEYSPVDWVEPGDIASYTFTNLAGDIEVRIASMHHDQISDFTDPVTMTWLVMPDPYIDLDIDQAVEAPLVVPSVAENTEGWYSPHGDEPVLIDLNGTKALQFTVAQTLETEATLQAGPISILLLVKNTDLEGQGVYVTSRSSPLPYMMWRGAPGGTQLHAGTVGNGSRAVGGTITPGVWRVYCATLDPSLPSNQLKTYVDGILVAEADAPVWDPGGVVGMLINSIYSDAGTGDGNNMILKGFRVFTSALPAPLVAQATTLLAASKSVTLGQP